MRRRLVITAAFISFLVGAARCTPSARDRAMRFFFEIPEPASRPVETQTSAADAEGLRMPAISPNEERRDLPHGPWVTRASFPSTHPPFVQRRCLECHDAEHPSTQRGDAHTVCGSCHAGLFAPRAFQHGPFASGACAKCHQPHVSALPRLMREPDPRLCLGCHERTMFHQKISQQMEMVSRCLVCHDPHATDEQYLLRPRDQWKHLMREARSEATEAGRR